MFALRNLHKNSIKTLTSFILHSPSKNVIVHNDISPRIILNNVNSTDVSVSSINLSKCFDGYRAMSTSRGKSMRSKVENRMRKESGKTLREIRRSKKLRKKMMTDEERLIYNLRRAKKKVALLLQKLKKYELPELPPPRHDPELLTPEQLQAYRKIGFRNKNYVPVGVRGVFGGVVQNMHLHWKFHETVQVCCDNFPKEKIKEMATMLARLSGGIVINVHNVKTIIMFRGRNYRQPKNLIPINTLTKRKALFKARFEQALDSQKLNIKKLEQQLRRMGVNPDDPVAMASIQRVASTFFNAIDKKEGSPYVFHGDKQRAAESTSNIKQAEPEDDSDQEELDKFIAEIEDAADREWEAEEAAEQEEASKLRYWNKEDMDGRSYRSELVKGDYNDDGESQRGARSWKDKNNRQRIDHTEDEEDNDDDDEEWNASYARAVNKREIDAGNADKFREKFTTPKAGSSKAAKFGKRNSDDGFQIKNEDKFRGKLAEKVSESDEMLTDLDDAMWESDDKSETVKSAESRMSSYQYKSSSDEESPRNTNDSKNHVNGMKNQRSSVRDQKRSSEDLFSDSEILMWESDDDEEPGCKTLEASTDGNRSEKTETVGQKNKNSGEYSKMRTAKEADEIWDSD
ncbi:CRM-domain containing factor CFM9, mitochondrial [Apium graveolens]|uniref:CRM-domain containing factor CFM9, mitochondrial n=1 Tax=Apium graveolens TaxID=4045 RepID=UPI003D791791